MKFYKNEFIDLVKLNTIEKTLYFSVLLIAFTMPLNLVASRISIIFLLIFWLISFFTNKVDLTKFKTKARWKLVSISLIYIMYAFGMLYSSNLKFGVFDLEIKSTLLIFPLFFATKGIKFLSKLFVKHVYLAFVSGLFLNTLILLILAILRYLKSDSIGEFYYTVFSFEYHPSYLAMYIVFAISIISNSIFSDNSTSKQNIFYIVLISWFIFILVLLSSKAGFIGLIISWFFLGFNINFLEKRKTKSVNFSLVYFLIFFVVCLKLFPNLSNRINLAEKSVNINQSISTSEPEGSQVRLEVWKSSIQLIEKSPIFGYGTGDVKDVLSEKFTQRAFNYGVKQKMNSHNQYLQTAVSIGLIGFMLLLFFLLYPLYMALKGRDIVFITLIVVISFNLLVESMLERQFGVVFASFFVSLLLGKELLKSKSIE